MNENVIEVKNAEILNSAANLIKRTVSVMSATETDGLFVKPNTSEEFEVFNRNVDDIIMNKIKYKLGI